MRGLLVALLTVWGVQLSAKDLFYETYDWDSIPENLALSPEESKELFVNVLDTKILEYVEESSLSIAKYELNHKRIWVNDDEIIQRYNKIYIPMFGDSELKKIRARFISAAGVITEMKQSSVKDVENLEGYGRFKIMAIDGVEKGGVIEYYSVVKKSVRSFFGNVALQDDGFTRKAVYKIISPKNYVFKAKAYNGFPEVKEEEVGEKRILSGEFENYRGIKEEKYAMTSDLAMRLEYKLSHNTEKNTEEQYTWDDFALRSYRSMYGKDKDVSKKIRKFVSQVGMKKLKSEHEKIIAIQRFVMDNFKLDTDGGSGFDNAKEIELNARVSVSGMVRLLVLMFEEAEIKHQLGYTSNRNVKKFDPDFMSWNYLQSYLIYFPTSDIYMAPEEIYLPAGMIPQDYINNYGIFIEAIEGKTSTYVSSEKKFIECPFPDKHKEDMYFDVTFSESMEEINVDFKREIEGYPGQYIHPVYYEQPEAKRGDVRELLVKLYAPDATVLATEVEEYDPKKPSFDNTFKFSGKYTTKNLIEKAGRNFLFNIGIIIGEQVEMYQEGERVNSIEIEYPHSYYREIKFTIPDGYKVKGLEKLNINFKYDSEGRKNAIGFTCGFEQEGNVVTIKSDEYYKNMNYPKNQIEEFTNVINAAADFNKIVLVFEKE